MKLYRNILLLSGSLWLTLTSVGQTRHTLTLKQSIELAQAYSPEAQAAAHTYRAAYWSYRYFRANYLPGVSLTSSPYLNRQINKVTQPDGTEQFIRQNQLSTDLALSISQNIWFTGGNLFIQTATQRMDELTTKTKAYNTQPITIGYRQSLFGYNSLKWDRRIAPVRFREDENLEVLPSVEDIVTFEVPLDRALELAYAYSPEMETYERMRLESKSNLAAARAERGLKADLYLQFGLSQTGEELRVSYRNPLNQQYVSLSLAIPILDWGRGKGKVRVAKSQMELVDTQVGQAMTDFELNVRKMVRQFNFLVHTLPLLLGRSFPGMLWPDLCDCIGFWSETVAD